jgi:hypothetical protein
LLDSFTAGLTSAFRKCSGTFVQLLLRIDALEVNVQHQLLERVVLHVAQQNLLRLASDFQVEDRRVEGFLLQCVPQRVVIQFDLLRGSFATVDDARVLPALRRRRLAPVPCCWRSKATTFM